MERNHILILVAVVIVVIAAAACVVVLNDDDSDDSPDTPVTPVTPDTPSVDPVQPTAPTFYEVTDAAGNTLKFDSVPSRIVSMDAISTEMLCELGLLDNIVGVQSNEGVFDVTNFIYGFDFDINYPDALNAKIAAGGIQKVGKTTSWAYEGVMNADPDLVVFAKSTKNLEKMAQLQQSGVKCIVIASASSLDDIYNNMTLLGKALGKADTAEKFNTAMQSVVSKIFDKCKGFEGKDVLMVSYVSNKMYAYSESNLKHVILRELGCTTNGAGSATGVITVENILEKKPDIIIFDPMGDYDTMASLKSSIESDPLWADCKALKNNDIYYLEYQAFQATGYFSHHFVHGIGLMAAIVFDGLGADVPNIVPGATYTDYLKWIQNL